MTRTEWVIGGGGAAVVIDNRPTLPPMQRDFDAQPPLR